MIHTKKIITLFLAVILSMQLLGQDGGWSLVNDENSVQAYVKESPDNPFKIVRVHTQCKTTFSALISLIKDADNHHNWIYANSLSQIKDKRGAFHWVYYGVSNAPWPVSDRDLVSKIELAQDTVSGVITIVSRGVPNYLPKKEGLVRVPKLYSKWTFTPMNNGDIDIEFFLIIDLGGNIPAWLVRDAISNGPFNTLVSLREEIQKPIYKEAHLKYITEAIYF